MWQEDGVIPYGDDYQGDLQTGINYREIGQHPRAKKIFEKYDVEHKRADLTVAEHAYFEADYDALLYAAFFGIRPILNYRVHSILEHRIRTNTLYQLIQNNEIKLHSFDVTAALAPLKISAKDDEILAPSIGTFVVSYQDIELILKLEPLGNGHMVEWNWYIKSAEDFAIFDKIFSEAIKKYNQYNKQTFNFSGEFIKLPDVSFKDIVLSDNIRTAVQTNIIDYIDSKKLAAKRRNGLPTSRGVIFEGVPGTGKTFLSRILAKTLDTSFLVVTNLQSEAHLNDIFSFAAMFDRIIILFEDIDIYVGHRDDSSLVSALLNKLDGIAINNHLIVLCTTNKVDGLDDALKNRPGRFDAILHFGPPNKNMKIEMLKGFCKEQDTSNVNFEEVIADIPEEYTGAYLKELYIKTVSKAIDEDSVADDGIAILSTTLFKDALKALRESRHEVGPIGFRRDEKN